MYRKRKQYINKVLVLSASWNIILRIEVNAVSGERKAEVRLWRLLDTRPKGLSSCLWTLSILQFSVQGQCPGSHLLQEVSEAAGALSNKDEFSICVFCQEKHLSAGNGPLLNINA